ncbi:MAG: multidrug DMT transporter permease [Burkholderiales bacterium]|jgi:drug/metabolite transporter (DMT)-like permease|nr:MAG: multidrug DMT transporter permease [Burkholderiales bacterium]
MIEAPAWLWIACTVAGNGVQTIRNTMQRSLVDSLGTVGATHVRFLFGLPFGLLFLAAMAFFVDLRALDVSWRFVAWAAMGGLFQITATAAMLAAMRERSFVVAIAYVKTEPLQIALFGFLFLGERLSVQATLAISVATAGVLLMSMPVRVVREAAGPLVPRAALLGVASGAMFALSAVGLRGAILALGEAPFYARATVTLAVCLSLQTAVLTAWLAWRERAVLRAIFRMWRPSLLAGASGALASQLLFLAFSLQTAAAVRTVGLSEILFAQAVSHRLFSQRTTRREAIGMATMVAGVLWLLATAPV